GRGAGGLPTHFSAAPFATLAALCGLYGLLALILLRAAARKSALERAPEAAASVVEIRPGIAGAFSAEWRRVLSNRGAFGLLVLAAPLYGAFYPQPYLTQILREVPIAVVDHDLTHLTLDIVQPRDAGGTVKGAARLETLEQARDALRRREVFAVVGIPPGTERDVLKGLTARLPVYADATYLIVFKA